MGRDRTVNAEHGVVLDEPTTTTCPFLEAAREGTEAACTAPSHHQISLTPSFVADYCCTSRHQECALFIHATKSGRVPQGSGLRTETETVPVSPPAAPTGQPTGRQGGFGRVQIAVLGLVVAVNALTAVAVTRSLLPSSPSHGTALVAPAHRPVSSTAPRKIAHRPPPTTAPAVPAPAPPTEQSWSFPAVPNVQGQTVLVLYNPAAEPVDAHLRISSGRQVFNPTVHIPPGNIVKLQLRPGTGGSSAVKLQSDRPIVPVRLATG